MSAPVTSLDVITDFLAQKRFAIVGLSRDPHHFSVYLFRDLCKRGYDVVPVNVNATELFGKKCFARVRDIDPPVDSILLMTPPTATDAVVRECAEAGVKRIWMYRAIKDGAVTPEAVEFCRDHGILVVAGECPFMFLPHNSWHKVHTLVRRISGTYPRHAHT